MNREAVHALVCLALIASVIILVILVMDTAVQKTVTYLEETPSDELIQRLSEQEEVEVDVSFRPH